MGLRVCTWVSRTWRSAWAWQNEESVGHLSWPLPATTWESFPFQNRDGFFTDVVSCGKVVATGGSCSVPWRASLISSFLHFCSRPRPLGGGAGKHVPDVWGEMEPSGRDDCFLE